jgi:chemotaxis protein CheC
MHLTDLERDALTELVNLGVSRAAASLRKMVGEQILLSVPSVEVMGREEAARLITGAGGSDLVAVHQDFSGEFAGRALLIFPETNSLELVRAVTGGELPLEEIIDLEQEALAETGNIILNGCLATIANMLKRNLTMSLPEILRGDGPRLFDLAGEVSKELVLFLRIDFSVRDRDIRGYIAVLMDMPALVSLKALLHEFIARVAGEDALS